MKDKRQEFMTRTLVVWLGALLCCALWGSAFPGIKLGYRMMEIDSSDTAAQILYAGCRFFLAGILAVIFGSILQKKILVPRRDELGKVVWLSLLQTILQYLFFYIGLAHTTGVKASIINGMSAFVAVLVAGGLFRQEKITMKKLLGCAVGFGGVIMINLGGGSLDAGFRLTGEGFIFLATVSYAFSSVYLKKYSVEHNTVMLSGYQFLFGGAVMSVCGYAAGGRLTAVTPGAVLMLLYLAFVSAAAYSLWGILLKYNPVSRVAVFGFMTPVFGVLLSALLLDEHDSLGADSLIALILVCIGIYIVNSRQDRQQSRKEI